MPDDDSLTGRYLRRLARARAAGDDDAAREAWTAMIPVALPRVRNIVEAFRGDGLPGGRIPAAEHDDVVQDVFRRIHGATFRGESVGEVWGFVAGVTRNACQDHRRRHVRHDVGIDGSLDEPGTDGEGTSSVALEAERAHAGLTDPARIVAEGSHLQDALARVDADKREVLELLIAGYAASEIAERLGISVVNAYQRRSRGLKQLRALLEEAPG